MPALPLIASRPFCILTVDGRSHSLSAGWFRKVGNAVISGLIAGVAAGLILSIIGGIWQWGRRRANSEEFRITLPASSVLKPPKFKFGVLHASNDDKTIINRVYWFKKGRDGKWHASIRHPKNVGFQYKCFVAYKTTYRSKARLLKEKKVIKARLRKAGYKNPTVGKGKPNRVWFILKGEHTAKDSHGNTNNHYYPE